MTKPKTYEIKFDIRIQTINADTIYGADVTTMPIKMVLTEVIPPNTEPLKYLRARLAEEINRSQRNNGHLLVWRDENEPAPEVDPLADDNYGMPF
jgi:hypothetical protein